MPSKVLVRGVEVNVARLYRQILRHAAVFPTKNRDGMVQEIKNEFKEGTRLRDERDIAQAVAKAEKGLEQLKQFTSIDSESDDWSFSTEQTPMPQPLDEREGR